MIQNADPLLLLFFLVWEEMEPGSPSLYSALLLFRPKFQVDLFKIFFLRGQKMGTWYSELER